MTVQHVAVCGVGAMGRSHIQAIQQVPELALSALVDVAPLARELGSRLNVPVFESLTDMLRQQKPDGVVLATPNAWHVPQALACIEAGLPCLLEKPIATDVTEAKTLVDALAQSQVPVLMGHHRAHSAIMREAVAIVQSGVLGRLVAVMGSALFHKPAQYFAEAPWRSQPGGGPILINLIHEIHNLRMLCGEVVSVQAMASNATRGLPVEDTVAIGLQFASGVLGTFMLSDVAACSRSWEQTARENPAYAHDNDEDCYVLAGTRGSLSIPTMRIKSFPPDQEPSWMRPTTQHVKPVAAVDPILQQMRHFAAVLRGEAKPWVSVSDGLANLRVTQAVVQAMQARTTVTVAA